MQDMVDVSASTSSPENGSKNDNSGRSIELGESASMYNEGDVISDATEDNPDDVSCEEIIVRDDERYLNLAFVGIIDASLLSLGSAPTGEEASPSSQGGTPATRERRACHGAKTKEAFGEQGRRFNIRNRREIKGDRSELHQSRGNEVEYKGLCKDELSLRHCLFLIGLLSSLPSPKSTPCTLRA